jgi:hypothetical protein
MSLSRPNPIFKLMQGSRKITIPDMGSSQRKPATVPSTTTDGMIQKVPDIFLHYQIYNNKS